MPSAYQAYTLPDIGTGLNRFHSLDSIPEGMMFQLQNLDPLSNGKLVTRKGYERYYGGIPLRANSIQKTDGTYKITFDSATSMDLSTVKTGPIVISGDIPSGDGPFTGDFSDTFATHYYSTFSVTLRETFSSGSPATVTKSAATTGVTQENIFVGWFQADSLTDNSNTVLVPEEVIITKSNYSIDMKYDTPTDIDGYFTYLEVPATSGTVHIETFTSQTTVSIPASTHGLSSDKFIIRCYEDDGTYLTEATAQTITADSSANITVTFGSATTGRIVVYATSNESIESAVAGSQTLSVTGVTDPFNFFDLWAVSGGTRTNVTPAAITWDASTETVSIEYVGPSAESVEVYWVPANYAANAIEVTGTDGGTDFTSTDAEVTVWGIDHSGIYKDTAPKGGFTNHIDNYKSELTEKMVTGLGGNLLQATSYADGGTTYKMASLTLRGSNRVSGTHVLAPLFADTSISYTRTRGNVTDTSIDADGYAQCTAVSYVSSGVADYTFTFDNDMTGTVSLGTEVSTNDYLTVRNCGNDRNNGTFKISNVTISTTSVTFRVANVSCIDATQDESGMNAQGNVFTDEILLTATPNFIVGDKVSSNDTSLNTVKSVDVSADNYIYIDSITTNTTVSDGINLYIKRTSDLLPLEDFPSESVGDDTDGGFVIGDSLTISGVSNTPKITYINTNTTQSVTTSISSGVATVTLTAHGLNVGQKVAFKATSDPDFEGEYTIVSIPSANTFTVSTDAADGSPTATIVGKTIEIDESLTLTSGPTQIGVTNQGRWTVIEMPKSSQARVLETKQQHWDESAYTAQQYLRSVVVNDSMFLVNDTDEVKKFDGTSLMNAGLPPWQGWFFANVDNTASSLPSGPTIGWDNGASNPNTDKYFVIDTPILKVGERFKASASGEIYTVALIEEDDVGVYKVYIDEEGGISASDNTATGTITKSNLYRYYIRLNAVDANRNIIASAALGADDMYVETFTSSAIDLKCGGLPPFEELDHDRIELEIYRTKRNQAGPFYRVHRRLLDYSALGGYINYTDTKTDDQLVTALFDSPLGGLLRGEVGNTLNNPPLAGAVTTADNRLILANIKSPPTLDITFRNAGVVADLDAADFSSGQVQFQKSTTVSGSETHNDTIVFSFENSATTLTPATDISVALDSNTHTWVDGDVTTNTVAEIGHNLYTGMKVRVSNSGGALPTGLAASTTYYVIRVDADNYKFASSLANACAGTAISLTTGGGGTHTTDVYGNHIVLQDVTAGGLSAGDWIYMFHNAKGENNNLDFAGWYRVSEADDATGSAERAIVDLNHNRSQGAATTSDVDRFVASSSASFDSQERVPVWIGTDGNLNQIYEDDSPLETKVSTRLALAINAVMSSDNPDNTYWATTLGVNPAPWLLAQGGQSYNTGELKVQMVDEPSGTVNFQWSGLSSDVEVYVNNNQIATSTDAASEIRLFNSRMAVSYPNFAEIFDNPFEDAGSSDSVIDVNPADGQEITAVIPFFGQSAFGAANLTQVVVAFKTSSIYLVNIVTGAIQKLQSQGQGCTAPRSVSVDKDGIIFANESGLYRLGWDMKIYWVGRMVKDLWNDDLDLTDIAEFAGHNYKQNRQYKISTVTSGNNYPSNVLVYDHTREDVGQMGSWTEYTNHAATGWANQSKNAFFGSQTGTVMKVRNLGDLTDYRDDASAIDTQTMITGGIHYGLPGNRKTTSAVSLQYQNIGTLSDIDLSTEQSLSGTFNSSTQVDISSDHATVRYSLAERKGTYLRVKVTKSDTKDEKMEISKLVFHTRDIGTGGVQEAKDVISS